MVARISIINLKVIVKTSGQIKHLMFSVYYGRITTKVQLSIPFTKLGNLDLKEVQ